MRLVLAVLVLLLLLLLLLLLMLLLVLLLVLTLAEQVREVPIVCMDSCPLPRVTPTALLSY